MRAHSEVTKGAAMTPMLWFAALLVLFGAAMLIAGVGASVIWFGTIAAGAALVTVDRGREQPRHPGS